MERLELGFRTTGRQTLINEKCGDGIMSAIDFYLDVGTTVPWSARGGRKGDADGWGQDAGVQWMV